MTFICSRAERQLCRCPHRCSWSNKDQQRWEWTGGRAPRWPAWPLSPHERSLSTPGPYPWKTVNMEGEVKQNCAFSKPCQCWQTLKWTVAPCIFYYLLFCHIKNKKWVVTLLNQRWGGEDDFGSSWYPSLFFTRKKKKKDHICNESFLFYNKNQTLLFPQYWFLIRTSSYHMECTHVPSCRRTESEVGTLLYKKNPSMTNKTISDC